MSRVMGIQIEGVGFSTSKAGGVVFCENHQPPTSATYEWVDAMCGSPGSLTRRVDPFTGQWSSASLTLKLDASNRIAQAMMATQRDLFYSLVSTVTAAGTTIALTSSLLPSGAPTASAGAVVYIGDEAILLGTHSGGGVYTGCTRAFWGTTAAPHSAGEAVALGQPYMHRRIARVIQHDDNGTETERWYGFVEDVSQVGGVVEVRLTSQLATILLTRANVSARNLASQTRRASTTRVRLPVTLAPVVTPGASHGYWQIGDNYLVKATEPSTSGALYGEVVSVMLNTTEDATSLDAAALSDVSDVYRVFAVDRALGESSTEDLDKPYHPLAIALALLMSTGRGDNGDFDVLGQEWGLGLNYLDTTAWEAAIDARPDLVIDRLVLGWGGEAVEIERVVRERLLRPFGYSITEDNNGRLALTKLQLPSIAVRATAQANALELYPDVLPKQAGKLNKRARRIDLLLGGAPYGEDDSYALTLADVTQRAGRLQDADTVTLDMRVIDPSRIVSDNGPTAYALALIQSVALGLDNVPELHGRVASALDTGLDIYPGVWVSVEDLAIEHTWWVTGDGERVELDGSTVKGVGLVVAVMQPFHGAYMDVQIAMLANGLDDYIHLVAPSGEVASWSSGTQELTLYVDTFNRSVDAATFAVGDQVQLWTSKGELKDATVVTINNITGNVLTVSGAFGAATPVDGDVLRLAQSDEYSNTAHYAGVNQPWTYMADASTQSFYGPGALRFDVYGTEVFVGGAEPVTKGAQVPYKALDSDVATAPSTTTALPLDAFLEQRQADNEAWLLLRDLPASQIVLGYHGDDLGDYVGIRPYATAGRGMTVQVVPVLIPAGWQGARVAMVARVANPNGYSADNIMTLRLDLYDVNMRLIKRGAEVELADTTTDTPDWQPVECEVALDRPADFGGAGYLVLWCSGNASAINDEAEGELESGEAGTDVFVNGAAIVVPAASDSFYDDTAGTRPDSDDLTVTAYVISRWDSTGTYAQDDYLDPLWHPANSMFVGPGFDAQGFASTIGRYSLTYIQFRGFEWSVYHADIGRPPAQLMESDAPTLGEVAGAHLARILRAHSNPRLSAVGPSGDIDDPYSDAPGYAQHWPRELHDNASTGQVVMDFAFVPARYNPSILVMLGVVATHCVPNGKDSPSTPLDVEWSSVATWEFQVDYYVFDATLGWVVDKTVQVEQDVYHQYTFFRQQGVLVSEYAHFVGDFPYREGMMYEQDLPYVQPVVLDLGAVDYNPATQDELVRVRVTLTGSGTPSYTTNTHADYRTRDRLQLAVCGCSIYEVP